MATLFNYNNGADTGALPMFLQRSDPEFAQSQKIGAQLFTPLQNYELSTIKLGMYRVAESETDGNPGTLLLTVRNVDENNKPVGSEIITSTTNGNTLPDSVIEWREFRFHVNPNLTTGTRYAIVLFFFGSQLSAKGRIMFWGARSNRTAGDNRLYAQNDNYPTYPPADDWADVPSGDFLFEVYGLTAGGSSPTNFPVSRLGDYDPDANWDPDKDVNGAWTSDPTDLTTLGGGRYGKQIVVLGHRGIYFGSL